MGDVIQVSFGLDRDWEQTRAKLHEGFVNIGAMFGDGEELQHAKAQAAYQLLRQMVDGIPTIHFQARLPEDLTPEQFALVNTTVREAVLRGTEAMLTHCVGCLMANIYDIATSKLAGGRNDPTLSR